MISFAKLDVKKRLAIVVVTALLGLVALAVAATLNLRDNALAAHQDRIKNLVQSATGIVANYKNLESAGKLSRDEAQTQAKEALRTLRYAKDDYFFIYDYDLRGVMIAGNAKLEGQQFSGKTDARGKKFWDEFAACAKSSGACFVDYWFPRAGGTEAFPKLGYFMAFPDWQWIIGTGVYIDDVDAQFQKDVTRFGAVVLVVLLLMGAVGWIAARSIVRQLGGEPAGLMELMQRAAAGDLTANIVVKGDSSSVLANLKAMLEGLGGLVRGVSQVSTDLAHSAAEVSRTAAEVSDMASHQSDGTSSMAAAMEEMTVAVNHIADSARDTENDSCVAVERATTGEQRAEEAVAKIQSIAGTAENASDRVSALVKRADEIGSITAVIKEIASQTNLLALNAAIEAARAGEQGRGFAVVADEVRGLAERTSGATVEIEKMIRTIQDETTAAVEVLRESVPEAKAGVQLTESTAHILRDIRVGVEATLERVQDVAGSTREQSIASNSIAQQVERIAHMVEETGQAMASSAAEANRLEQLSQTLQASVSRFRV